MFILEFILPLAETFYTILNSLYVIGMTFKGHREIRKVEIIEASTTVLKPLNSDFVNVHYVHVMILKCNRKIEIDINVIERRLSC